MDTILGQLNFEPLFYIIDKGRCQIMVVKKQDRYEYKGLWLKRQNYKWHICPACIGKHHLREYITNYDFTNSKEDAINFAYVSALMIPMTTEQMQHANSNPDYHY